MTLVSPDDEQKPRFDGVANDIDTKKEAKGYSLDHPDAACAAFC